MGDLPFLIAVPPRRCARWQSIIPCLLILILLFPVCSQMNVVMCSLTAYLSLSTHVFYHLHPTSSLMQAVLLARRWMFAMCACKTTAVCLQNSAVAIGTHVSPFFSFLSLLFLLCVLFLSPTLLFIRIVCCPLALAAVYRASMSRTLFFAVSFPLFLTCSLPPSLSFFFSFSHSRFLFLSTPIPSYPGT